MSSFAKYDLGLPPRRSPDMRTFVESTARYVAKNGLESEKTFMAMKVTYANCNYNFLKNSDDPFHGLYKEKLIEYLTQKQDDGSLAHKQDDGGAQSTVTDMIRPDDVTIQPTNAMMGVDDGFLTSFHKYLIDVVARYSDDVTTIPPPLIKNIVERTALYFSCKGLEKELEAEKVIMEFNEDDATFGFLSYSHPFHSFYRRRLALYFSQRNHLRGDGGAPQPSDAITGIEPDALTIKVPPPPHVRANVLRTTQYLSTNGLEAERVISSMRMMQVSGYPYHAYYKRELGRILARPQPKLGVLPRHLEFGIPHGMTLEEFDTMKVTAQFVAGGFVMELTKRASVSPPLEFMKPTYGSFDCFNRLVAGYSEILVAPKDVKEKLRESAAYTGTIVEGFINRLQWDCERKQIWREKRAKAMIDWHASVAKDFANKEDQMHPEHPQMQPKL